MSNPTSEKVPTAPSASWLVADMGGTNARFGWVCPGQPGVRSVRQLSVADHPHLAGAAGAYLDQLCEELGTAFVRPTRAALAVATAVGGDFVSFTNSPWAFSARSLQAELGLDELVVLNDFEALALSLPRLQPHQVRAIGSALPRPEGVLAVVGPGTGLGVAGVLKARQGWVAVPGEGGHATLAAGNDFESALLACVRRQFDHVSAERLLSGIGLPYLHSAVSEVMGQAQEQRPSGDVPMLETADIVARGLQGSDAVCVQTLQTFCALLGSFAGSVALTLGARSGVYIGGGIVPRLGEYFFASQFRERFEAKGRFRGYLQATPTALITDTLAALEGATLALEQSQAHG
jgi:glucokinase